MAYLSAMVLGSTMAFSSCSNDDNNNNTPNTAVNPKTVFTGGLPKSAVGMTIRTNEKGQVATLQRSYEKATFEYIEPTTYATNLPNVIMTVENSEEKTVSTFLLFLNKNGFVTHSDETTFYKSNSDDKRIHGTWDFTYNNDGQLLTMSTLYDNDDVGEKTNIIYNNGDIFAISREHNNGREKETCRAYYTSPSVSSPIPNKGCIMVYGSIIMDITLEGMEYAYYAGLLGKANKNLPVRVVDYDNDTYDITWTLNSAGYPISLNDGHKTYSFEW